MLLIRALTVINSPTKRHLALGAAVAVAIAVGVLPKLAFAQESKPEPASLQEPLAQAEPDDSTPNSAPVATPWGQGVSPSDRREALLQFREGNEFYALREYSKALTLYRVALKHWKHPAIFFNTAVCQVNLDRPIEAYDSLSEALRYEDAPLGEELYAQALTYKKLLDGRLSRVVIELEDTKAQVSLNGTKVVGKSTVHIVLPGKHVLVAEREGHVTFTQTLSASPGQSTHVTVKLHPVSAPPELVRPMAAWIPWTVSAAGAALLGTGVGLRFAADNKYDQHVAALEEACPAGCTEDEIPDDVSSLESSAQTLDGLSIAGMAAGGAALAAGVTLLILNAPRAVESPERIQRSGSQSAQVLPVFSPHGAGVHLKVTF